MGYRSDVVLKTTTEGYLVMKKLNDSITETVDRPLQGAEISRTESGFYRILFENVKWYDSYKDVQNFIKGIDKLDEQDIPYKFIRIGEEYDDVEVKENYTDDMPEELCEFNPDISVYDTNEGEYEIIEDES